MPPPHLKYSRLLLLSIVYYSFCCDCETCTSTLDFEVQKIAFVIFFPPKFLFPVTLSAVIISKVPSSYGFKCACVVDVTQLTKSSSWVKQEASLLIWASWLISLVLIYRRRLGVIPSLVFPLPTLNGTSDKRPPTHSSCRSVITARWDTGRCQH